MCYGDSSFLLPGRILNRFSKDMGSIDELLPSAMIDALQVEFSNFQGYSYIEENIFA
jgi:hypothetical protein